MPDNKIMIKEFEDFLQKSTFNYNIDQIKIRFTKDIAKSSVIGTNVISSIEKENSFLLGLTDNDEIEFNVMEPKTNIRPILNLIEDDNVDINIEDDQITLKKGRFKSVIHFCDPHIINEFRSKPKELYINHSMQIDDDIKENIEKIIKTCLKLSFKKIYFGSSEGLFFIETTDRTNKFSNKLRYNLQKTSSSDFTLCFNHTMLSNLSKVMGKDYNQFRFDFSYLEDKELGRMDVIKSDESEIYYLMSEKENI